MISRTTKTIGGRTVEICRCAATEALDLELSIAKVAGSADIVAMLTSKGSADEMADIIRVVGGVAKSLTHAELLRLMNMLFQYVSFDGKVFRDINEDFSDRPRDIWEVFIEAIMHNLGPLGEGLRKSSKPESTSPTTT